MQSGNEWLLLDSVEKLSDRLIVLPHIREPFLHFALPGRQMAIHEHEARVIEIKSQRNRSLVCGHALGAGLVLDRFERLEAGLVVAAGEKHDEAAEHDFTQDAGVVKGCWA